MGGTPFFLKGEEANAIILTQTLPPF